MKEALKLALEVMHNQGDVGVDEWIAAKAAIKAALAQPEQEPVVLKWQQAPIRTAWGDDMVVASIAIDNDHTLSLYCERDQTPKVDVMFAQRTWVGLTDEEVQTLRYKIDSTAHWTYNEFAKAIEAKLKEKNNG